MVPTTPVAPLQGWKKWNEMNEMEWRNGGMKFMIEENGRNSEKNLPTPISSTKKSTWSTRDVNQYPSGGRWATNRLCHKATLNLLLKYFKCIWIIPTELNNFYHILSMLFDKWEINSNFNILKSMCYSPMLDTNDSREEIKCSINMRKACYHSFQKIMSFHLFSKKLKVNTYKTIIMYIKLN